MIDIQNKVIQNYNNNLQYLQNIDLELYNKVITLSNLIDSEEYKERYHLEYLEALNNFDIYDTQTKTYLYNKNPNSFTKNALKHVTFDKLNSFNLFTKGYYDINQKIQSATNASVLQQGVDKTINDLVEYTNIFQTSIQNEKKVFKTIPKFVIIGTLLGTHIPLIDDKLHSNVYFICESNLEIFRLSLFVTDYSLIGKNKTLIFSIMDNEEQFKVKFQSYLNNNMKHNYMIKYYCSNYNISNYFDRILNTASYFSPFTFPYPLILDLQLKQSFKNIQKYNTFNTSIYHSFLKDKSVLLIAAGPSFHKNISWIKENKNKFFIVSIGASLVALIKNNIIPDMITTMDPASNVKTHFPDDILSQIKNIPIIAASATHEDVLSLFDENNIFLFEMATKIKSSSGYISGTSIGETTLFLLSKMGADKIYLLGTDLALDQETGKTHLIDHNYTKQFNIDTKIAANDIVTKDGSFNRDSLLLTKGNFKNEVVTTAIFKRSLIDYSNIIKIIQKDLPKISIYNLSDGAYIENTIPLYPSDCNLDILDRDFNFLMFLRNNSNDLINEIDRKNITELIVFLDLILNKLSLLKNIKTKNYTIFTRQRLELLDLLFVKSSQYNNYSLNEIFKKYIQATEPYIAYYFNDSQIKNESSTIKKIKNTWINQIEKICINIKGSFSSKITIKS